MNTVTRYGEDPQFNVRLNYALDYLAIGWAVVPLNWLDQGICSCGDHECKTPGKHPYSKFARHGVHSASKDVATVTKWFTDEPRLNIGIACGEISDIVVLDVDPRNGGDDALYQLEKTHGKAPDTVTAHTGGNGQHFVYRYKHVNFKSPGKGLDVLGNGKLFVVSPSMHKSGKAYEWEAVADPLDGCAIADAPFWMIGSATPAARNRVGNLSFLCPQAVGHLTADQIRDLRDAMGALDVDSYDVWLQCGMALHSTSAPEAFEIWDTWSQTGHNYGATQEKWESFTPDKGLNYASIFAWAQDIGWKQPSAETIRVPTAINSQASDTGGNKDVRGSEAESISRDDKPVKKTKAEVKFDNAVPSHLLSIPGVLNDLVIEINKTSDKKQPQFAVQTALALGAVALGRRYVVMPRRNFSSQYFMAVGESGCGKEYGKKIIETVLRDARLETQLLGPSGYTSDSAVFSELAEKPNHISLMDELGLTLKNVVNNKSSFENMAFSILIGLWGRLDGTFIPKGRSALSAPRNQDPRLKQPIECPAVTLYGMSTPGNFYESLTPDAVEGGFLSRFLIVQTNLPLMRPALGMPQFKSPQSVLDWLSIVRDALPHEGNLAGIDISHTRPVLREVAMSDDALKLLDKYYDQILDSQMVLQKEGYAELENRSAEKVLRLCGVIAVSENPANPIIKPRQMQWCIDYVRFYTAQMVNAVRENMVSGLFGKRSQLVLRVLKRNSEASHVEYSRGMTIAEMADTSRVLGAMNEREWCDVLNTLARKGRIEKMPSPQQRGRTREAFRLVAAEER